jgi:hypothetical protein
MEFHYPVFALDMKFQNLAQKLFPQYNNVGFSMKKNVILLKAAVNHITICSVQHFGHVDEVFSQ